MQYTADMKTATLPPLRVEPELRKNVERLLSPGETVSTFVEQAVLDLVERRQADEAFGRRALSAKKRAAKTGSYHSIDDVMSRLQATVAPRGRKR